MKEKVREGEGVTHREGALLKTFSAGWVICLLNEIRTQMPDNPYPFQSKIQYILFSIIPWNVIIMIQSIHLYIVYTTLA